MCKRQFRIFYKLIPKEIRKFLEPGRLGGSVGQVSDFSSGHDLTVHEFEPRVGRCADSSEPGACFGFCLPLSFWPSPTHALSFSLSLSKINKH